MIFQQTGPPPGKSLKLSQLCGPGSAICDAGWPTPDCPWSMLVCRSQKKYFRNFNFNFNYRELLSKSATFSLRSFGVVLVTCRASGRPEVSLRAHARQQAVDHAPPSVNISSTRHNSRLSGFSSSKQCFQSSVQSESDSTRSIGRFYTCTFNAYFERVK